MEYLYAIRDAFFWWAGVWATITLVNHGATKFLRKRRLKHSLLTFADFESARLSDETQADTESESEPEEDA